MEPSTFKVRELEHQDTKNFLRGILMQQQCVPFLGAGFTGGEPAREGKVPFGAEWLEIMKLAIVNSAAMEKPSQFELEKYTFQEVSDVYFRDNIVPLEEIKSIVNRRFTGVKIKDPAKQNFLRVSWPYVYTLNIDDGIEACISGIKVLPYKEFARHNERRFVYKLHGDAEDVMAAASKDGLNVIFGKGDYVKSLVKNESLISDLTNDLVEKHLLFIGCSLNDELDILFALASVDPSTPPSKSTRIYVTSKAPESYSERRKLQAYGITDVIVGDYSTFYNLAADYASAEYSKGESLAPFAFVRTAPTYTDPLFIQYLLQAGWNQHTDPYNVSIKRKTQEKIKKSLDNPIVVVWGRRFSGRTTILRRILNEVTTRRSYFIPSSASVSDQMLNEVTRIKDAIIAFDSNALRFEQMRLLSFKADRLRDNNTTLLIATLRNELNAFGPDFDEIIELDSTFSKLESEAINLKLSRLGYQKWNMRDRLLDNIFTIANSPISNRILHSSTGLAKRVVEICTESRANGETRKPTKLEFTTLVYLATNHRIYSRVHRTIAKAFGGDFMLDTNAEELAKKWAPFIEYEQTDKASRSAEKSNNVLVCNSYAWLQFALRKLADSLGLDATANYLVDLYTVLRGIDSAAYELLLFDNLRAVFDPDNSTIGTQIITRVYEALANVAAQDPNYWLQRAKSVYYSSNQEYELRAAVAYCEKGIVEDTRKAWINAKLTKANLLGKLCVVTQFASDADISSAVHTYYEAISDRDSNPAYIDELLKKSRYGKGYMSQVLRVAHSRPALLLQKSEIQTLHAYIAA